MCYDGTVLIAEILGHGNAAENKANNLRNEQSDNQTCCKQWSQIISVDSRLPPRVTVGPITDGNDGKKQKQYEPLKLRGRRDFTAVSTGAAGSSLAQPVLLLVI